MAKNKSQDARKNQRSDPSGARRTGILTSPIRTMTITALICLVLGAAFLIRPRFVYDYCGYAIGGLVCFIGLVYVIMYFARKPASGVYRSEFAVGLMALAVGGWIIFASFMPDTTGISITLRLIVTALGVLIAADGILKLQYSLDLARMKYGPWWVGLIVSLLGIALGVLTAMGLVDSLGVRLHVLDGGFLDAMLVLGIAFCFNALLDLIALILVAARNRRAAKEEAVPMYADPVEPSPSYYTAPVTAPAPGFYAPPAEAPVPPAAAPAPAPAPAAPETPAADPSGSEN